MMAFLDLTCEQKKQVVNSRRAATGKGRETKCSSSRRLVWDRVELGKMKSLERRFLSLQLEAI